MTSSDGSLINEKSVPTKSQTRTTISNVIEVLSYFQDPQCQNLLKMEKTRKKGPTVPLLGSSWGVSKGGEYCSLPFYLETFNVDPGRGIFLQMKGHSSRNLLVLRLQNIVDDLPLMRSKIGGGQKNRVDSFNSPFMSVSPMTKFFFFYLH